jgi:hypothetical protein
MRSRFPRHLRHLTLVLVLLGTAGALAGTTGVLASITSLPLGTSSACGCEAGPEFQLTGLSKDEFDTKAVVNTPLKLEAKEEPTIECKKMGIEKGVITNDSPEATIKSIDWEECEDKTEAACKVPTIKTTELVDTLQADGSSGETDEKFKPKSGEEIANFKLEGTGCKPAEENKTLRIEGDFISKKEDNDTSEDEHKLGVEVTEASDELKYGDQPVFAAFIISFHWGLVVVVTWSLF